jgi:tetratricopeptide (TPR) repeat protein
MPAAHSQSGLAQQPSPFGRGTILRLLLVYFSFLAPSAAAERLIDRQPFDEITLNETSGGRVLEVAPLDLPGRRVPATPPGGDLKVELLDEPGQAYVVAWSNIAQIRLYESRLLAEAQRLTAADQFDEAYDYFARLLADYPSLDGLDQAASDYLRRNALALYEAKEYERALALLGTLYQRDPKLRGLAGAVETVAGQIIDQHLRDQDYAAARAVLAMWRRQFKQLDMSAADAWERRFTVEADRRLNVAKTLVDKQDFIAARRAAQQALAIWPELESAHQLLAQIQQAYPSVTVGVFESSPREPARRLDCWAASRANRLVERALVEQVGFGSEGGVYRSPYGRLELDDRGLRLSLKPAAAAGLRSDVLTRYLLSMADASDPDYRPGLAGLLAAVVVDGDGRVDMELSRPHVRPEALLEVPPPDENHLPLGEGGVPQATRRGEVMAPGADAPDGRTDIGPPRFTLAGTGPDSRVYSVVAKSDDLQRMPGLRVLVERTMPDDEAAVSALISSDSARPRACASVLTACPRSTCCCLIRSVGYLRPASSAEHCASESTATGSSGECCSAGRAGLGLRCSAGRSRPVCHSVIPCDMPTTAS